MEITRCATIKEIVEYGLEKIPADRTITVRLSDFMYIYRVLEEYMRFFHNTDHYPSLEAVKNFLGGVSSGGGFEVLNTAIYHKMYPVELPHEVSEMLEEGALESPFFPEYYNSAKAG